MNYSFTAIGEADIPTANDPALQYLLDTYASETNKLISIWRAFSDDDLAFRPHSKSGSVGDSFRHELLSGRRFFAEFLQTPEPDATSVLPAEINVESCCERMHTLVCRRLPFLATRTTEWWLADAPFFDVTRQRIWIFWRRVLHSAHHRSQLTVYLRLLNKKVPPTYGPTADVSWSGADPTHTVEAAKRH